MSAGFETIFLKAKRAEQRGEEAEARRILEDVLKKYPGNKKALGGMARLDQLRAGLGGVSQSGLDEMLRLYARDDFAGAVNLGLRLVARFPQAAEIWNVLGAAYLDCNDLAGAERAFRTAVEADPAHEAAAQNLLLLNGRQGNKGALIEFYRAALRMNPADGEMLGKLAELCLEQGKRDDLFTACEAALVVDARLLAAHYWMGKAHLQAKEHMKAIDSLLKAIAIDPEHFDSVFNLGHALFDMGKRMDATDVYHQATIVGPDNPNAYLKFGEIMRMANRVRESLAALRRARELSPDSANIHSQLLYQEAVCCDWHARHEFRDLPIEARPGDGVIPPFIALTFEDDAARQLGRSKVMAQANLANAHLDFQMPDETGGAKIRIGYFSADFHDHATVHLISGLLREHDRERFEIRIYSFGGSSHVMDDRVRPYVDEVIDIRDMTDAQIVECLRNNPLDIAVDLKGYTTDARMELFASRVAPVQIAWLGYPGSVGADFMDYMIADSVVVPVGSEHHYSERIIRLPGSYQPNDNRRVIGACPDNRPALGLPAEGFVFCCFNQNYKIGPQEYDVWMRLLDQVEGSVLWLIRSNPLAEANLRKEAVARGIDPDRIVFADRMHHNDHLARHAHADLFLDTFAVNAHTTASDALWGGLPVLTLAGEQFAARVAASLLTAIDMPDLVAVTVQDYEAKALDLARSPEKMAAVRARLATNRLTTPLFDTVIHTRHMEAAYRAAHDRRLRGLEPDHIMID